MKFSELDWVRAGNLEGAHGIVDTNLDANFAAEIARRTDFPGSLPNEVGRDGIVSLGCFALKDRFVLYEIGYDSVAKRAGMAASGAISISLGEVGRLPDLQPIIKAARDVRHQGRLTDEPSINLPHSEAPFCVPLIEKLSHGRVFLPIDCDQALVLRALWRCLPSDLRIQLRTRLCFSTDDLGPEEGLLIGFVPRPLRWVFPSEAWLEDPFGDQTQIESTSYAQKIGLRQVEKTLGFIEDYEIALKKLSDIDRAERLRMAIESALPTSELVSALRICRSLSGGQQKDEIDEKLIAAIISKRQDWQRVDVQSLRNINLNDTPLAKTLSSTVTDWIRRELQSLSLDDVSDLMLSERDERCSRWWRTAVFAGFNAYSGKLTSPIASQIWATAATDISAAQYWLKTFKQCKNLDHALAKELLLSDVLNIERIQKIINPGELPRTTAKAFVSADGLLGAVGRVGTLANPDDRTAIIESMCSSANEEDLVVLAGIADTNGLSKATGNRLAVLPKAIDRIDIRCTPAQTAIATALSLLPESADGAFPELVERVFKSLVAGVEISDDLILRLSERTIADAYNFNDRQKLWACLSGDALSLVLERSAKTWLNKLTNGQSVDAPEPELREALAAPSLSSLRTSALDLGDLASWNHLVDISPSSSSPSTYSARLIEIVSACRTLEASSVARMGAIVHDRNWRQLASRLVREFNDRTDLGPAWSAITPLLGFWERWNLPNLEVTEVDIDHALEALLAQLYYWGPGNDHIWERAGGRMSDVVISGQSGSEQWKNAIRKVTRGNYVTRTKLLRVAIEDHPNNTQLDVLLRLVS